MFPRNATFAECRRLFAFPREKQPFAGGGNLYRRRFRPRSRQHSETNQTADSSLLLEAMSKWRAPTQTSDSENSLRVSESLSYGLVTWQALQENLKDQFSRLAQHKLFGSRLESDVVSLPPAEQEQWFELCARFETVSNLDYKCRQYLLPTSGTIMSLDARVWWEIECRLPAMRRQPEPGAVAQLAASMPAAWFQLLDRDLRVVIFEWSRSQWQNVPLEVCLRIFLAEHRSALE